MGRGKAAIARMARRVLPDAAVRLRHVEPETTLEVSLRRHIMFWSKGLTRFEPQCVGALRAAAEPGDTCFDVGANIGFFSTLLSRWVGPTGRVLACEPEPRNLALLRRNLAANGCANVTVCDVAVGAEVGQDDFSLDEATGATGHLGRSPTAGEMTVGSGRVRWLSIRVETIDALVEEHGTIPALIKFDIEGGEAQALRGASRTLEQHRPILTSELNGDGGLEVVATLHRRGYRLWDLETGRAVGNGDRPFMIVALPDEAVDSGRGRRIRGALQEVTG